MSNACVLIITGSNMGELSNQYFKLNVARGSDHSFVLEKFMLDYHIDYPFWDYCFSHDAVKLAVLGNIVILIGGFCHIVSLPDEISFYQKNCLEKFEALFYNEKSCFAIMNISKELERIVYEAIDSSVAKECYFDLVERKHQNWKDGNKILKKGDF